MSGPERKFPDGALLAAVVVVACLAGIAALIGLVAFLQGSQ